MNKTIALIPHYNNFSGLVKTILSIDVDEKVDILIIDDGSSKDQIDESILKSKCFFKGSIFIQYLKKNIYEITYVLSGFGLQDGYVAFSIEPSF